MVKKFKKATDKQSAAHLFDGLLAGQVKESAQQIWLAGLGAFSRAQAEGTKVFESLVKEGTTLHKKTQSAAEDKLSDVAGKMSNLAGDMQSKAGERWDKIEGIFQERISKAMKQLGVPSAKDVQALSVRIDELQARVAAPAKPAAAKAPATRMARVDELARSAPPSSAVPPAKKATAAKKTPVKRAARKSSSA